jgi:DNA-binding transcriptional LysR family regulator
VLIFKRRRSARPSAVHIETLKTFCDLVETGSFSKAARLNFVSQSAVSQQIKALEARYDRALLERGPRRGAAPTEAGRLLYAACKELLERLRVAEERLQAPAGAMSGPVKIATVYSIGLYALPPYVKRFMQAHPQVKVHIEYSRTDRVCDACVHDTIDLGIVAFPVRRAPVTAIPWREEKLVMVCAPGHRLARRRPVNLAQLRGEDFIAFERDIPTRRTIDRLLKRHGVAVNTVMEFDNIETIKRAVEVGSGLSILPDITVANEAASGVLVARDFVEGPFTRTIGIIHRRGRVLGAAAREFLRLIGVGA